MTLHSTPIQTRKQFPLRAAFLSTLAIAVFLLSALSPATQLPAQSNKQSFLQKISAAAIERTTHTVRYDPAYVRIPYPNGDVPAGTGVCTDEVIRSYRALGIDLQKEVHEDMQQNFSAYHTPWGLDHTDTNIDHRRVPNLMVFFSRKGESLSTSRHPEDYSPGDLVTWDLGGGVPHIGIVVDRKSASGERYLLVHNIGRGPQLEDVLFDWKITGHYRYYGHLAP
jgi:uncharacterized protein